VKLVVLMGYLVRGRIPDGQSNLLNRWLIAACRPLRLKGEHKQKGLRAGCA